MPILLSDDSALHIRREGESTFPDECCGFLLGAEKDDRREVHGLRSVENVRLGTDRRRRYTIAPEAVLAAEREAEAAGISVLGFYHSHPNAPARPSEYDREHAWPWYSYVIVSVHDGRAESMTSWVLRDDRTRFDQEEVVIENKETTCR